MWKGLEKHGGTRKEAHLTGREAASQSRSHFILFYFQFCEVGGDHPSEALLKFGYRSERNLTNI